MVNYATKQILPIEDVDVLERLVLVRLVLVDNEQAGVAKEYSFCLDGGLINGSKDLIS